MIYFFQDIKDIYLLYQYKKIFEPESIALNFRTFQDKYPALPIPASGDPFKIPVSLEEDVLPDEFNFMGEQLNVSAEIKKRQLTSLIIIKEGKIIYEKYFQGNTMEGPVIIFSCTKSMMGLLTGIAYEKGYIQNLSDPVEKYATELKGTVYEGVTIQNVLNMSSGVRWDENYAEFDSDIVQSLLASLKGSLNAYTKEMKRIRPQGVYNQYTSMDAQVLGMVIQGASKIPLKDFFTENLWNKIYPENKAYFLTDATGFPLAYGGLIVSTRDLAKIGLLMLNGGKNQKEEQIFSESWIKESTTPDEPHLMPGKRDSADNIEGYKNQWWFPSERSGNDFSALGIYGQTLYINPEEEIIIASNSAYSDYTKDKIGDARRLKMFQSIVQYLKSKKAN